MISNDQVGTEWSADRLDLNKLRTFAAIADRGGVSAAAETLGLSRSAVSHALAGLESDLELRLFHRVGKRMVLSAEGDALWRAYRDAAARLEDALGGIFEQATEARGRLRVGLFPGFSRFRLAATLGTFLERNPGARCRLVHGTRRELSESLRGGRLDFLLSLGHSLGPGGQTAAVHSERVFSQSLVLAHAPELRRGRGAAGLAAMPFVDYFRTEPLVERWLAHHEPGVRLSGRSVRVWVGAATDVALELTLQGTGACVLPADLVEPYRTRGELRVARGRGAPLRDEIWLHELAGPRRSALRQAFRDALGGEG